MKIASYTSIATPVGDIWVAADELGVFLVKIGVQEDEFIAAIANRGLIPRPGRPLNHPYVEELKSYFAKKIKIFTTPLHIEGSDFDRRVWEVLRCIPIGETRTYQEVAELVGSPRGWRAVGGAVARNPLPLFVPCHRVICKNGAIGGFSCGVHVKEWLLDFERGWSTR